MRASTYGFLFSVFTVVVVYGYTVLNTKHLLDVIKHQPGCFPPYTLMSQSVSSCHRAPTVSPLWGGEDGLIPHAPQLRREAAETGLP